jgi:hypothetical protein
MIAPMYSLGARMVARTTRLTHRGDLAAGELRRVGDDDLLAVLHRHVVHDVRGGRDEVEVELALEPLAHDLEVQQPEEPARKPNPRAALVSRS